MNQMKKNSRSRTPSTATSIIFRKLLTCTILISFVLCSGATIPRAKAPQPNQRKLVASGFQDQRVLTFNFDLPTGFDWLPDGRLLVLQKKGIVWLYEDFQNSSSNRTNILDLQNVMCDNSERGIMGLALHPKFNLEEQQYTYIYLYYTYNKYGNCDEDPFRGPVNRLSRFLVTESLATMEIDKESEHVLLETPPLEYDHHNSGDLVFGKDGYLYATIGDGGSHQTFVSQDDSNVFGTIVRLTDDGNIPPGNPFTFENGFTESHRCWGGQTLKGKPCQEIYATGLRNPYRFAMDPNAEHVRFYINDVGQATWEEISEGGSHIRAGANYGWPYREGPCENNKKENCAPDSKFTEPVHYYVHRGSTCITGGAFVPNGVWPVEYDGAYLYADYVLEKIWIMTENGNGGCATCNPPISDKQTSILTEFPRLLGLKFGPYQDTQALYYTSNANGGELRRVSFVGGGNYSPQAHIATNTTTMSVSTGQTIELDATQSSDPNEDDLLQYQWTIRKINKEDTLLLDGGVVSVPFSTPGLYVVTLTVKDGRGGEDSSLIQISVGNKPLPTIDSIPSNATFAVGDLFVLSGTATDEEDGALDDFSLTWEVRQHHDTHFHPFLDPTQGNHIQLQAAPAPEDYEAATNSYLEVILTATDSDGLSNSISQLIQPKKVLLYMDTSPSGLELILDGLRITTPINATSWENHKLQVIAPTFQYAQISTIDGGDNHNHTNSSSSNPKDDDMLVPYSWKSWSNGQSATHDIYIVPPTTTTTNDTTSILPSFVAEFEVYVGTNAPSSSPTMDPDQIIGLLMAKREYLLSGESRVFPDHDVILTQETNGNLELTRNGVVVWQTNKKMGTGTYFTYINGGSNMITKVGTPDNRGRTIFSTRGNNVDGDYFLGLNPDDTVSVYAGKSNNPGFEVWNSVSGTVTKSPTVAPTKSNMPTTTLPPSTLPSTGPTLTFSGSPSSHPSQSQVPSISLVITSPPTTIEPVTLPTSSSPTNIDPPTHISFHWIDEYVSSDDTQPTVPAAAPTKTQDGTIPILQPSVVPVPSSRPVPATPHTPGPQEKFSTSPTKNDEDPISINFAPSIPSSSSFSSFSTYYQIFSSVSWTCFVLVFLEML